MEILFQKVNKMASSNDNRKRDFQADEVEEECDQSFTMESCVFRTKKRRRTIHGSELRKDKKKFRKENALAQRNSDTNLAEPATSKSIKHGATMALTKRDLPGSLAALRGTIRTSIRRQVSSSVLHHKLKKLQDYSLPDKVLASDNFQLLRQMSNENKTSEKSPAVTGEDVCQPVRSTPPRSAARRALAVIAELASPFKSPRSPAPKGKAAAKAKAKQALGSKDTDLQQKIDHEIKMREGTTKLLAASKHPNQRLEAARSLLCSNTRIIAYMTELQRRKTQEVLGQSQSTEGNQLPCRAQVSVSDIRIPLMWKDTDHFKNKGDYRQYAVFCLLKVGTEIFDTSMITNVDRSMTDITFEDVVLFQDIPHDFELKLEVYCHKLHEELSAANTPKKIRKKITDISGSVGRSVGKRLSGLNDADVIGSMVLGPRFELVAKGTMQLQDVDDSVRTFDFELERNSEGAVHELPLFGHYCCRIAAVPDCLVKPVVCGFLNVQEDDDLSKWRRYWCVLKNLQLACWSSPSDIEIAQPLLTIPITKLAVQIAWPTGAPNISQPPNPLSAGSCCGPCCKHGPQKLSALKGTQISDADPSTCTRAHTFLIKTVSLSGVSEHTLAADSKDEVEKWWDGFQQHLLDQALWKHACDYVMEIKPPTKNKMPFYRKSSIYDDTPLIEPDTVSDSIVSDLKVDDAQLSQMLTTLMGEASQIRGTPARHGSSKS